VLDFLPVEARKISPLTSEISISLFLPLKTLFHSYCSFGRGRALDDDAQVILSLSLTIVGNGAEDFWTGKRAEKTPRAYFESHLSCLAPREKRRTSLLATTRAAPAGAAWLAAWPWLGVRIYLHFLSAN